MRVLLVTGSYPPMRCGIGDYSLRLAEALVASGVKVGVLTSVLDEKIQETKGVEVFSVIKAWRLKELPMAIKIIRSWAADIVHIQHPTQGYSDGFLPWVLPLVSFLMKKKVVQTWHEAYCRSKVFKLFLKSVVPSSLIFVRSNYRDCLHPALRWSLWGKKTEYIPSASCIPCVRLDDLRRMELKKHYLKDQKRLIVFFGFIYPHKGVELLFEIADPTLDQIIIAGVIDRKEKDYLARINELASSPSWKGKVTITDFLPAQDIADLLAITDAVVLPFRTGGGDWNTSIHAAVLNGVFVVTTSSIRKGYDEKRNIYFAKINDIKQMRSALSTYAGRRRKYDPDIDKDEWLSVADMHRALYERILS